MNERNKKLLIQMIARFVNNATNKNAPHNETGGYMVPVNNSSKRQLKIIKTNTDIIQKIYNYIVKFSRFKYMFSNQDIHDLLIDGLISSYGLSVDQCISNIIHTLLTLSAKYFCIVPIYNLKLDKDIQIEFLHLYLANQRSDLLRSCNCLSLEKYIHNNLNFAGFYVEAGHPNMALSLAYSAVKAFTDACSVLFSRRNLIYIIKPGNFCVPRYGNEILIMSNNGKYVLSPHQYFSIRPLFLEMLINNSPYKELLRYYLAEIVKIEGKFINGKSVTTIEHHFLDANKLVAEGINSEDKSTKVVKFISALEILLVDNKLKKWRSDYKKKIHIGKSNQVSHKVPYLLKDISISGKKFNQNDIKDELHYLYKIRSDIVHRSIIWINDYYLDKLWTLSRLVLLVILRKYILQGKSQLDLNDDLANVYNI